MQKLFNEGNAINDLTAHTAQFAALLAGNYGKFKNAALKKQTRLSLTTLFDRIDKLNAFALENRHVKLALATKEQIEDFLTENK